MDSQIERLRDQAVDDLVSAGLDLFLYVMKATKRGYRNPSVGRPYARSFASAVRYLVKVYGDDDFKESFPSSWKKLSETLGG